MSWSKLPRPNPCLPCMVGNPKRRKNACPPSVHIDMPGSHSARGKGAKTYEKNANPRIFDGGAFVRVSMSARDVAAFKSQWPASGLPDRSITFEFDKRNGDLVDMTPSNVDGPAALAMSEDAWKHYESSRGSNPKLMVLNPASDPLCAAIERKINRRLTAKEKTLLAQAAREFKTFHGRAASPKDIMPVEAPPGTPIVVSMIGRLDRTDYTVPIDGSERKGRWTHEAGDHGRKYKTPKPYLAAIPGRKTHNTVIVQPKGAKTYFKPTHGLMG